MKQIIEDEIPYFIRCNMINKCIDICLKQVEEAGLLEEFEKFIELTELCNFKNIDEIFINFAEKYPEKFYIVPEKHRLNSTYFCSLKKDKMLGECFDCGEHAIDCIT